MFVRLFILNKKLNKQAGLKNSIEPKMACFCSRSNFLYKLAILKTNAFSNSHESSKNISIFNHIIWCIVRSGRLDRERPFFPLSLLIGKSEIKQICSGTVHGTLSPFRSVHAASTAYSSSIDSHINKIYSGLSRLTHLS